MHSVSFEKSDLEYMNRAIELAGVYAGFVSPNPVAGAVIVKDNRIIGEGAHKVFGGPHAEVEAISSCVDSPVGATMYVNLEPCCHHGKTPPCTDSIIKSGIKKVVIGTMDPNPVVNGKGVDILRNAGLDVITGVAADECRRLNRVFFHFVSTGTPFTVQKYAMTADGKIATRTGESRWISCPEAREHSHRYRHIYSAILVGIGTVIADNPSLDCRIEGLSSPVRIICDTNLRINPECRLVQTADRHKTVIATAVEGGTKHDLLQRLGCHLVVTEKRGNGINLTHLMQKLGNMGIDSVLVEGGAAIHASFNEYNLINRFHLYISPVIFGGAQAPGPVGGTGIARISDAPRFRFVDFTRVGTDIFVEGEPE